MNIFELSKNWYSMGKQMVSSNDSDNENLLQFQIRKCVYCGFFKAKKLKNPPQSYQQSLLSFQYQRWFSDQPWQKQYEDNMINDPFRRHSSCGSEKSGNHNQFICQFFYSKFEITSTHHEVL